MTMIINEKYIYRNRKRRNLRKNKDDDRLSNLRKAIKHSMTKKNFHRVEKLEIELVRIEIQPILIC